MISLPLSKRVIVARLTSDAFDASVMDKPSPARAILHWAGVSVSFCVFSTQLSLFDAIASRKLNRANSTDIASPRPDARCQHHASCYLSLYASCCQIYALRWIVAGWLVAGRRCARVVNSVQQIGTVIPDAVDGPTDRPEVQHPILRRSHEVSGVPCLSPSHTGQCSSSRITGIRSCNVRIVTFATVVRIAKLRSTSPPGPRQPSHTPANASGAPSFRAIA